MTDKELLELTAKACNYKVMDEPPHVSKRIGIYCWINKTRKFWNPLTDDGDALRLAVKLRINLQHSAFADNPSASSIECGQWSGFAQDGVPWVEEPMGNDPYAATRRAIVRAAAAIGRVSQ